MTDQTNEPSMFADFSRLDERLKEDQLGDVARSLMAYFNNIATSIDGLLTKEMPQHERDVTIKLLQGVWAAQRVIKQVWEKFHHTVLVL
jgi:hypothetical protein